MGGMRESVWDEGECVGGMEECVCVLARSSVSVHNYYHSVSCLYLRAILFTLIHGG